MQVDFKAVKLLKNSLTNSEAVADTIEPRDIQDAEADVIMADGMRYSPVKFNISGNLVDAVCYGDGGVTC